jgi:hypothetical protein
MLAVSLVFLLVVPEAPETLLCIAPLAMALGYPLVYYVYLPRLAREAPVGREPDEIKAVVAAIAQSLDRAEKVEGLALGFQSAFPYVLTVALTNRRLLIKSLEGSKDIELHDISAIDLSGLWPKLSIATRHGEEPIVLSIEGLHWRVAARHLVTAWESRPHEQSSW